MPGDCVTLGVHAAVHTASSDSVFCHALHMPVFLPLPCCTQLAGFYSLGRCVPAGDQFALFESVVALSMLMRRFDFHQDPNAPPVGMTTGATIHTSNGLHVLVTPRCQQV